MINSETGPIALPFTSENTPRERHVTLLAQAKEFESIFVAQMLKLSGLTKAFSSESNFGGGAFSSMLVDQYADKLVENGGFGLTDKVYQQLMTREAKTDTDTSA